MFLPRAIDKVRATLPGGTLGQYFSLHPDQATLSSLFYRRLGITHDEFVAAVAAARDERDVAAWLRERADEEKIAKWAVQLPSIRIADVPEEHLARLFRFYPAAERLSRETPIVDLIDADDRALFAS